MAKVRISTESGSYVYHSPTDEEFQKFHDDKWNELPVELQDIAVAHLKVTLPESLLQEARKLRAENSAKWMTPYHFTTGMGIRNSLRSVILDNKLPSGNWDDYYVKAIETLLDISV